MTPVVDQDLCIGCGLCTSLCEEVFELNNEGKANSVVDKLSSELEDAAKDAESSCPVGAIIIE